MPSLLQTEAVRRRELLEVHRVHVELDLTEADRFASTTTIEFSCTEPGAATFVDFSGVSLASVELNGEAVDPEWVDGRITLRPAATNTLVIAGTMAYSNDGEGLHQHIDPADGRRYVYAMSFLDAGPRWFAAFDQPDLKAPYSFAVATPPEWTVAGNSPARQVAPGRWRLEPSQPLASYFVTLVAGEWASVMDEHDGIALAVHTRQSLAGPLAREAGDILAVTKRCFDAYHRLFGVRYPFGEYHQAFVPDFNAGAMENPGCVTYRDQYMFRGAATGDERGERASTIAHEMAHQWFGNLVTMRWWDDLWLNESFAELMGHLVCSRFTDYDLWPDFALQRKDWGSLADQSPSTHPVAGNGAPDAAAALAQFDGISYAKGAAVLRQLHQLLGEDVFLAGLADYFAAHAFGNATMAELLACWQARTDVDLAAWAAQWLSRPGMDVLRVELDPPRLIREAPEEHPAERSHVLQVAGYAADGREVRRIDAVLERAEVSLDSAAEADPPPRVWLPDPGDVTWARIRPAPGWASLPPIAAVADPIARIVIDNSIRDGVRAAELDPALALNLLLGQATGEPDTRILAAALDFALVCLAGAFCPSGQRAHRRERVAATVRGLLEAAEPGSDRQLALLRLDVRASADLERLRALLAGDATVPGRPLDEELRWLIVRRLAEAGEAAVVDSELRRDPSTAARVHAARCRAALPGPEAKAAAWAVLTEPGPLSAYEVYATAEGFFDATPPAARPYVERYFAEIDDTARFRSGWALARVVALAFPSRYPDADTLALARGALAREDLTPAVRRVLVDGVDRLRRAHRSLQRWGSVPEVAGEHS